MNHAAEIAQAAVWSREADGLFIAAGAGMGVDSGLPDFRGTEGFWQAYPALMKAGTSFREIANPQAFATNPQRGWGFYGHRLNLYRATVPHAGFGILQDLAAPMAHGYFVFTSNVDGQFQQAGFDPMRIMECHGSIHHLQCLGGGCPPDTWEADRRFTMEIDDAQCLLKSPLPKCRHCGGLARPNILMFNDWYWVESRTQFQDLRMHAWRKRVERPVIIELGAGTDIPSVRVESEMMKARLIRINPREAEVPASEALGIAMPALAALQALREAVR
jgi:NAD-dependent SIR2 family protein deacetylase